MTSFIDPAILTGAADTLAGLILPIAIKVSLLLGLFGILNLTLRRASASTRHLIWTLGLVGILLLPILGAGLPSWQVLDLSWLPPSGNGMLETIASTALTGPPLHTTQQPNLASLPHRSSVPIVDTSRQTTAEATSAHFVAGRDGHCPGCRIRCSRRAAMPGAGLRGVQTRRGRKALPPGHRW